MTGGGISGGGPSGPGRGAGPSGPGVGGISGPGGAGMSGPPGGTGRSGPGAGGRGSCSRVSDSRAAGCWRSSAAVMESSAPSYPISAAPWDRHLGCPAAGSPALCRGPGSALAPECQGPPRPAGEPRRPVCHLDRAAAYRYRRSPASAALHLPVAAARAQRARAGPGRAGAPALAEVPAAALWPRAVHMPAHPGHLPAARRATPPPQRWCAP
jgi:hypothetical protein